MSQVRFRSYLGLSLYWIERLVNKFPYWCLNRHLCDLREGFGKKRPESLVWSLCIAIVSQMKLETLKLETQNSTLKTRSETRNSKWNSKLETQNETWNSETWNSKWNLKLKTLKPETQSETWNSETRNSKTQIETQNSKLKVKLETRNSKLWVLSFT